MTEINLPLLLYESTGLTTIHMASAHPKKAAAASDERHMAIPIHNKNKALSPLTFSTFRSNNRNRKGSAIANSQCGNFGNRAGNDNTTQEVTRELSHGARSSAAAKVLGGGGEIKKSER